MRPSSNATDHAESLRLIGKLTAGLAHDLNQTLGLIAGYTELSLGQLPRDASSTDVRRYLELAHRTALDGSAMLSDVLRFARGEASVEAEPISLRELLTNVAELTSVRWRDAARAEGRKIHLHVDADDDASVLGWRQGLLHMFMNLVFNAIDALPRGGSITLRARRIDELVEIRVIDTGVGMPPRVQQRIFEPFFTTRGAQGTGLGMVQIRRTVEQHAGSIEVSSTPCKGTSFVVKIPREGATRHVATPSGSPEAARAAEEVSAPVTRSLRVLVVDDEPALASLGAFVLSQDGHSVSVAHSAEHALRVLTEQHVDAVVSDLTLGGGMTGLALAAQVKRRWPATAFVLVTGWGAHIDRAETRAAGVDTVITKPYRLSTLRQALADRATGLVDR